MYKCLAPGAIGVVGSREQVDNLVMLLRSVLESRRRVMLEINVPPDKLDGLVTILPCMREPTVATLAGDTGYAVKAAVPRSAVAELIPDLKARGGTEYTIARGDTLSGIAQRFNVSLADLKDSNGITGTKIMVGQKLTIPAT